MPSIDPAANIESVHPLSPMQEGMLFHTLLQPRSGIYLMQNRYRLEGELEPAEFVRAWEQVVARHAILRTSFVWKTQKRPLQVVHREVAVPFDVLDWRDLAPADQEARLVRELGAELAAGFDFARPPLMRFRLIRLADRVHELVHSFHHILLDEWCTSLLMMDFLAHFEALLRGQPPAVAPVRPYRDYIEWLGRQDRDAADAFWRAHLRGFTAPTPLGFEERGSPGAAAIEDRVVRLGAEPTAALAALAKRHRLTLNTIVQGAWALLLSRYSGEREVVFGVTVAGRPPELPDVESIAGLFINTLPLRIAVDLDQPVVPWLRALFDQNLRLRQYEYTPLVDIQRSSELERGQALFASLLVFENAPIDPVLREGRIVFQVREVRDRVHTNYPLTVMSWNEAQLPLKLSYDPSRVSHDIAAGLLEHLGALLEAIARDPDARLGELTMTTEAARRRAVVAWNPPPAPLPDLSSFAARFAAQVVRTPDALAVTCGDTRWTYAALDREARRLAHALVRHGVGPEDRVALLDERGVDLLAMIVAVFQVGAAYVPIEPGYPAERITRIIGACRARVVLTRERYRALVPADVTVVTVEDAGDDTGELPAERGGPEHLAYVIYTSGSTGTPKGVMVERRGMLNNMLSKIPRLGLGPGEVIAQTASSCFDISVWQFLTALLFGGCVDIVPDEISRDPARLLEHVERRGTTILEVVPAVLQGLLDAERERERERERAATAALRLRWVLPTGEALPPAVARDWLTRHPAIPLMNAYGPAECSDDVSLHPIATPPGEDEVRVAIGTAVEHLRMYVLDRQLDPAPVGVRGELHVGGIGVGRGYLDDPRRTAAAFVPDPFSDQPGRRLYRTGDLGCYRADGTIELVGRRDHQIKLRGFRIELGDIEAHLIEHDAIADAAVVVDEDRPGHRRLVAYVAAPSAPAPDALRAWLADRLPAYMVPATYVVLPVLPRNGSGKVDRRALPAPERDRVGPVAPRTSTEETLAAIWADVLGLEQVGVEDSFFDLGGHSLFLTQILARVRRAFDVEVPLRALFEAPTVAAHARVVDAARAESARADAAPLLRSSAPPPLSFAQERLWFLAQLEPTAAAYNVPAAVRLTGALDVERLGRSFEAVVRRHDALRTRFVEADGRPTIAIADEQPFELAIVDTTEAALAGHLDREAARPFELTSGPLVRVMLFRLSAREHVLLVVVHHVVSDGWSMQLLVEEVTAGYAGDAAPPPLPIQYGDYARWQRDRLQGAVLDQQLAYWRQRLSPEPPVLRLPSDRPRPTARSYRGARHNFELPHELAVALGALARGHGVSSFMLLLAGFQTLLGRYAAQDAFGVGTPIANRGRVELEGLIGLFVNTLVLRADLAGDPRFTELLVRTRDEVLGAHAHQDLPFERLVQALRPARDLRHTPLFQVMFSLEEAPRRARRIAGVDVAPVDLDPGSTQFDLSLHMAADRDALSGWFEYSTDLFDRSTIVRIADDLRALLAAIVARPTARLSELPVSPLAIAAIEPSAPIEPVTRAARPDAEARLAAIWAEVLGREAVGVHDNFFELGGDSIVALQVVAKARQAGLRVAARDLFQHPTVATLAAAASALDPTSAAPGLATGDAPLTPIQRAFFARALPNPHHWNQAVLLAAAEPLDGAALEAAVAALVRHHDALRLRFVPEEGGWRQTHVDDASATVHRAELSGAPDAAAALEAHATRWQASLDLTAGPLFRVIHFDLGRDRPGRLLLIAHHLIVDGVSWRILLEDLHTAYDQVRRGERVDLPAKTTSFQQWAARLHAAALGLEREAATWLALPWERVGPLPVDHPTGDRSAAHTELVSVGLDAAETRALLEAVPEAYRMRADEVMLAALARAIGRGAVAVEVEGHGREELDGEPVDLSRTVGWLTSVYPVVLDVAPDAAPGDALVTVKEQLRRLPRRGLPFGVVRELGTGAIADRLRELPRASLAFNYLGQWDGAAGARLAFAPEPAGLEHDPRSPLPYELEIDAAIHGGRLDATWRYSRQRYRRETVVAIAERWRDALRALITHAASPDAGRYTPSDFPDVSLAADELAALLGRMD